MIKKIKYYDVIEFKRYESLLKAQRAMLVKKRDVDMDDISKVMLMKKMTKIKLKYSNLSL